MFPKLISFFLWIAFGLLISSCAMMIEEQKRAPVADVSVSGGNSTRTFSGSRSYNSSVTSANLQPIQSDLSNTKNNTWVSPVPKNTQMIKKFSKSQPRISYQGEAGKEVFAVRQGTVEFAGEVENLGLVVILKHSNGFNSIYLNNYRNLVSQNQTVRKGQLIAQMGIDPDSPNKGRLNFELRRNNRNINPLSYF